MQASHSCVTMNVRSAQCHARLHTAMAQSYRAIHGARRPGKQQGVQLTNWGHAHAPRGRIGVVCSPCHAIHTAKDCYALAKTCVTHLGHLLPGALHQWSLHHWRFAPNSPTAVVHTHATYTHKLEHRKAKQGRAEHNNAPRNRSKHTWHGRPMSPSWHPGTPAGGCVEQQPERRTDSRACARATGEW
jgi:hypothetical protein